MKFFFTTRSPFIRYAPCKRATGMGEALAQLGHEVTIAALDCEENRARLAYESPNCQHFFFPNRKALEELRLKLREIWRFRPDFLYAPTYEPRNFMGTSFLLPPKTRFLVEVNELDSCFADNKTYFKITETLSAFESDMLICASVNLMHHYQKLCKKLFLKKKLVYSPYAFPEYLKPIPNTNTRAKTISFLVSLTKEYGIFDFLKVIYEMTKERKDFQARIIGQGPEENNVRTLINELGISDRVTLTGYVEETSLGTELNKSDVFISPMTESAKDIFRCPSKIYYYLPYEKPIVTCRVGEVPHALADYGYYYQPGDSADMKRALYEALSFKGNLYPPEFVQNHSWKTRAKQFINDISY